MRRSTRLGGAGPAAVRRWRAAALVLSAVAALAAAAPARSAEHAAAGTTASGTTAAGTTAAGTAAVGTTVAPAPLPRGGPVPGTFGATSVSTAAPGVLYALGQARCSHPPCTSLVRTLDNGRSWRGVQPPRAFLGTELPGTLPADSTSVRDVRFATARDGYLFGGALWSTHDGSASTGSWHAVDLGGRILDLATDGRTVWALVARCRSGAEPVCTDLHLAAGPVSRDRFIDTVAVGTTSEQVLAADLEGAGNTAVVRAVLSSGTRSRTVLLVKRGAATRPTGSTGPGGTWRAARQVPFGEQLAAVVPTADARGVLVAFGADAGAGHVTYQIDISRDGGSTWLRRGGGLHAPNGAPSFAASTADDLVHASYSPDFGGDLSVTHDGGTGWRGELAAVSGHGWQYVGATGSHTYLALTRVPSRVLWRSGDRGTTWFAQVIR